MLDINDEQKEAIAREWKWRSARIRMRGDFRGHPERRELYNRVFWGFVETAYMQSEIHAIHWKNERAVKTAVKEAKAAGISVDELERLESALQAVQDGKIDKQTCVEEIGSRFSEVEGTELDRRVVEDIGAKVRNYQRSTLAWEASERFMMQYIRGVYYLMRGADVKGDHPKWHLGSMFRETIDLLKSLRIHFTPSAPKDALKLDKMRKARESGEETVTVDEIEGFVNELRTHPTAVQSTVGRGLEKRLQPRTWFRQLIALIENGIFLKDDRFVESELCYDTEQSILRTVHNQGARAYEVLRKRRHTREGETDRTLHHVLPATEGVGTTTTNPDIPSAGVSAASAEQGRARRAAQRKPEL